MSQITLADNFSTAAVSRKPQLGRSISQNLRGAMPARLITGRSPEAILTGTAALDPGSIADGDEQAAEVTVTGAALGDIATASFSLDVADLAIVASVTAANTVTVSILNNTGGAIDLAAGTVTASVKKASTASAVVYGANIANPWANRANTQAFRQRTDVTDANLAATDYGFTSGLTYAAFSNYNWHLLLDEFEQMVVEIGTSLGATISDDGGFAKINFTSEADTGDTSETDFVLLADYNLLEHLDLQIKVNSVVVSSDDYTLSDDGNGKIKVVFDAAPAAVAIAYQLYPKPGKNFGLVFTTPVTIKTLGTTTFASEDIVTKDSMWLVTGAGVTSPIHASVQALGTGS